VSHSTPIRLAIAMAVTFAPVAGVAVTASSAQAESASELAKCTADLQKLSKEQGLANPQNYSCKTEADVKKLTGAKMNPGSGTKPDAQKVVDEFNEACDKAIAAKGLTSTKGVGCEGTVDSLKVTVPPSSSSSIRSELPRSIPAGEGPAEPAPSTKESSNSMAMVGLGGLGIAAAGVAVFAVRRRRTDAS
jgi:hypothetical protein